MTSISLGALPTVIPGMLNRLRHVLSRRLCRVAVLGGYGETKAQALLNQQVSILFTDIVGFSSLMSTWPLEVVVASLHNYFEILSRCVYRHRGQVDKFIGDGMMAVFESPDEAVGAGQAIQRQVAHFNLRQAEHTRCCFPTRIGIDTGLAVRTMLGTGRNRNWTVMGPVVNTASHLAQIVPSDRVFISQTTFHRLTSPSDLRLSGPQVISGSGGKLVAYEVKV